MKTILIIGQNFSGKNDFFNDLVGNRGIKSEFYPRTQIQFKTGYTRIHGEKYRVINAPGIYTLIPNSEYETVTLNLILDLQPDRIIFVTREETLQTSMLILIQLAELGIPFIVGYQPENNTEYVLDSAKLAYTFNTEVIVSSPIIQQNTLKIKKMLLNCPKPRWVGKYASSVEKILREFEERFRLVVPPQQKVSLRFICLLLLLGNQNISAWIRHNYPLEISEQILAYAKAKYQIAQSFSIANRWESLSRNLFQDIWQTADRRGKRLSSFFEKYSLRVIWDVLIAGLALSVLFGFVYFCGNRILVNIFYNEIFGKYLIPACTYLLTVFCGESFLTKLFVGPYGLLTTGVAYALAILLPLMAAFFFIYTLLENSGYIQRLELTFNRLLKLFRLNGYAVPVILFSCCKISALNQSKTLPTRKERAISLLFLLFFIPCLSQLAILINLLVIIPANYALIYLGVMFLQFLILLNLQRLLPRQQTGSHYLARIIPLHLPDIKVALHRTWIYIRWYLRDICPLIIGISLLLFLSNVSGLLDKCKNLIEPLIERFLDLPPAFTDSIILGLFRKDFSAASLYDLANNDLLNSIQVLICCLFISLSVPCLGFVSETHKQHGWPKTLLIFIFSTTYAFTVAALVNKILRI